MHSKTSSWLGARGLLALGVLLASSLLALASACGGGGDDGNDADKQAAEDAVTTAIAAWNAQDVDGFLALVTDNLLETEFEVTREEAQAGLADQMGDQIVLGEFTDTSVSGSTASTTVPFFISQMGAPQQIHLVKEGDVWLVDSTPYVAGDAPEGATVVDLALTEYAFNFDASAITDGNIAFDVTNLGGTDHEVALVSVPADMTTDDLLQQIEEVGDVPESADFLGAVVPLHPEDETMIQFQEPLDAGHYVLVCFLEAEDGTPHAFLGMVNEFTIE